MTTVTPETRWQTITLSEAGTMKTIAVHIVPHGDTQPHSFSHDCWCTPADDVDDPGLASVWVHNSADGREKYEVTPLQ